MALPEHRYWCWRKHGYNGEFHMHAGERVQSVLVLDTETGAKVATLRPGVNRYAHVEVREWREFSNPWPPGTGRPGQQHRFKLRIKCCRKVRVKLASVTVGKE